MKSHLLKLTATLAAFGFVTATAHAVAVLTLSDGVNPIVIVNDNNLGVGANTADGNASTLGALSFNGTIGNWSINVAVGTTQPVETAPTPSMHLSSVNNSSGAGTMVVTFTDTFTFAQANKLLAGIGGAQPNGSVKYEVVVNGSVFNIGTSALNPFAFSSGYIAYSAGTYDITQRTTITHSAAGTTSVDATVSRAPDASSTLALLGGALIGLGLIRRRIR